MQVAAQRRAQRRPRPRSPDRRPPPRAPRGSPGPGPRLPACTTAAVLAPTPLSSVSVPGRDPVVQLALGQRGQGVRGAAVGLHPVGRLAAPLEEEADPAQRVDRVHGRVHPRHGRRHRGASAGTAVLWCCDNYPGDHAPTVPGHDPPPGGRHGVPGGGRDRPDGRGPAVVPRHAGREPLLGQPGRPGRCRRVRRVVPPARRAAGDQRRRVRHGAPRADPVGDPAADRRAGPGRRSPSSRSRSSRSPPGDERRAARGRAALLPRDRLRRGPGLRPGRRGARRMGRPARGAGRRRPAARRGRRLAALPGRGARLGQPRLGGGRRRPGARCRAGGGGRRDPAGRPGAPPRRAHRRPGRPAASRSWAASTTPSARPATWWRSSAPARSSSGRPCPTCSPRARARRRRSPA